MVDGSEKYDRPRASILTNAYLNYLDPDVDYEPSNPSQFRARMRDRIARGLEDLGLLFKFLEPEELRRVFGPYYPNRPKKSYDDDWKENLTFDEAMGGRTFIPGALAFLFWGASADAEPDFEGFAEELEKGIDRYLREKQDLKADITVTVELENVQPVDEWLKEFENG